MATKRNYGVSKQRRALKAHIKSLPKGYERSFMEKQYKASTQKNPPKLRPGVWIKADKVRVVQRNGRKVVEIKRFVKAPKRKPLRRRRK